MLREGLSINKARHPFGVHHDNTPRGGEQCVGVRQLKPRPTFVPDVSVGERAFHAHMITPLPPCRQTFGAVTAMLLLFSRQKFMGKQRDPYLPPPEVCDWLLAQEWSKPMEINVSCAESWGVKNDYRQAMAAIGRDECIDLMLPMEALQLLKEDAAARREAIELKRRELMPDELARKAARERNRADESEREESAPK